MNLPDGNRTRPDVTSEKECVMAEKNARILFFGTREDYPVFDSGWTITRIDDLEESHRLWRAEPFDLLLAECNSDLDRMVT